MEWLFVIPFLVQGAVMFADEFHYHRKRGLPRWERIGHPLDTFTVLVCYGVVGFVPFSEGALQVYAALAVFSVLFVTKDEWVHARACPPGEHWLHALLFVLHPVLLAITGLVWALAEGGEMFPFLDGGPGIDRLWSFVLGQGILTAAFFIYQIVYWNFLWKPQPD